MTDIIKTWPGFMEPRKVLQIFPRRGEPKPFHYYVFTLGRGRPKKPVEFIWFTYRGRILGRLKIQTIVQNVGQIPALRRLDGGESAWQLRPDAWVAICPLPFEPLREKVYCAGFRGWRYFDFASYRGTLDAKVRI